MSRGLRQRGVSGTRKAAIAGCAALALLAFLATKESLPDEIKLGGGTPHKYVTILDKSDDKTIWVRFKSGKEQGYEVSEITIVDWPGVTNAKDILKDAQERTAQAARKTEEEDYTAAKAGYDDAVETLGTVKRQAKQLFQQAQTEILDCNRKLIQIAELARIREKFDAARQLNARAQGELERGAVSEAIQSLKESEGKFAEVTKGPRQQEAKKEGTKAQQLLRELQARQPLLDRATKVREARLDGLEIDKLTNLASETEAALAELETAAEQFPATSVAAKIAAQKLRPRLATIAQAKENRLTAQRIIDQARRLADRAKQSAAEHQFGSAKSSLAEAKRWLHTLPVGNLSASQSSARQSILDQLAEQGDWLAAAERAWHDQRALQQIDELRKSAGARVDSGELEQAVEEYERALKVIGELEQEAPGSLLRQLAQLRSEITAETEKVQRQLEPQRRAAGWFDSPTTGELLAPTPENFLAALRVELGRSRYAEAKGWHDKLVSTFADSELVSQSHDTLSQLFLDWGTALLEEGRYEEAIEKLDIVRARYPDSRLAAAAAEQKARSEAAIADARRWAMIQRFQTAGLITALVVVLAMCAWLIWRLPIVVVPRSLSQLRKAESRLDAEPARVRLVCSKVSDRLDRLAKRTRLNPRGTSATAWAQVLLAILDHRDNHVQSGLDRLERVRQLLPAGPDQRRWLVKYYAATERIADEAVRCYLELCQSPHDQAEFPSHARVVQCLRSALEVRPGIERDDLVLVLYLKWNQEAQKLFPQETWPRVGEGQAWFRMGRHDRARRVLEELLAEHPESWEARACLARVYWALGEHDRARQELTTLTSERSQEPAVILEVTSQLAAAGMWKEADEMLKRLSDADPGMKGEVLALKAKAALHFGRPAAAVPLLERALQIKPGDARLALLLAEAQSRAGDDLKALETLQSVAAGDTQDTELEYAAGCALFNLNRFAEASRWFERCGRVNFRPRSLPLLRARCSIKQGEYQQAIRVIQEARELNKESAEPAFYQGVALYLAGSAKQALPHFVRAYNLARKANNEALAHRARVNSCACYYQMGNQHVRDGKYVLAAQAYDVLRKNLKPAHPHFELITQTLLTCYVQAGLEVLVGNEEDGKTEAIPLFEKAASLGAGARVRMTLAGLYSAVTRYDDAVTLYDAMLREAPGNESLRFARALASSRTRTGKAGTAELERVFAQGGRYAVRAALALASAAAETKHFERAVETLLTAARLPGAKKNKYYGELCCKAVLYSVRAGNVPRARELAAELLERSKGYADVLVGSLIADDGDFVTALPYLDAGVPQDGKRTSETLLLEQVYRRAAYQLCEKKQFESAAETLERAIDRGQNGPVHQFARLAQAASKNAATSERIDEPVLRLLDELYRQGDRSEAMLVRSVAVAYHRRAYELATAGQHAESRRYWSRAHQLWIQEIRGKGQFWTDFISTYNRGQQYKLESNAPELEEHMLRQMGGLCVSFCGAMLEGRRGEPQKRRAVDADDWDGESTYGVEGGAAGRSGRFGDCDPNFDDAEFYFKEAKQLAGQAKAVEMFKEIVDVNAIIRVLDAGRNPSRAYHLFKFLYDKIDRSDEYKKAVGNAALGVAVDALQSDNVSLFMEWLDKAADHDSDMRTIRLVVRQLGQPMITRVLSRMSELGVRAVLRAKQPQMAGQFLLAAVVAVAQVNAQLRSQNSALSFETLFALLPDQARAILDEILAQVIKNLSGAS